MVDKSAREIFVKNMHRFMEEKRITQTDISQALRLTASTVSDWYNGKNYPRVDTMQRLADLFDVSTRELTTEVEEEYSLTSDERRLLSAYRAMTKDGKERVQAYVSDMLMLYQNEKNESIPSQGSIA